MTGIEMLREYVARETSAASCNRLTEELGKTCDDFAECSSCRRFVCEAIVDRIERETLPRPRFEDGEPVQWGDEYESCGDVGKVDHIELTQDGWMVWSSGHAVVFGSDCFLKRPEPPDSWERLAADIEACDGSACRYFGRNEEEGRAPCCGCKAYNDKTSCTVQVMSDLVRRAKKLAGVE